MSHQITKVDIIPNGELSVCNVSQFDNGRVLPFEIQENKKAYTFPKNIRVELHCRKPDGNIVTLPSENITDNIVTFLSTTQLTACYGKNICEIALYGPDDYLIGSANFILDVEKSPTLGGITSTSEIHNLETQVEEITTEIIGENYYNKTEVDDLLSAKADSDSVYTIGEVNTLLSGKANASDVYTKSQTDTMLNAKADVSDLPDMTDYYTKTATDALLDDKANATDVYTKTQTDTALASKADKSDTYTKEQVDALIDNIFPTFTASGAIASFITALTKPLVSVTADEGATTITRCGVNLWDEQWEVGTINNNTGALVPNSSIIRSKNFIPISGGVTILLYATSASNMWLRVFEYDKNKNFIASDAKYTETTYQLNANTAYLKFYVKSNYGTTYNNDISILYPSDTTPAYHTYNGQTVPVSEATTLETLSGVNNVFADVGDVTVGYKYMPMQEAPNNSNRLLLSSVNSDIIKEKSEIKEQSDIIEDIERGDKNE